MRAHLFFLPLLLLVPGTAAGQTTIKVESTDADWDRVDARIIISLDQDVPASLHSQVLDPNNYEVVLSAPTSTGDVVPAIEATTLEVVEVTFSRASTVVLHLEKLGYGSGTVELQAMASADAEIEATSSEWSISQPFDIQPTLTHNQAIRLQGQTAVVDFSFTYGGFHWKDAKDASRFTATLEGSAPLGTPEDVEEEPEAETDASEEVADFYKLTLLQTSYAGKGLLQSYGLMARSTAQFEGLEVVGTYQLARLFGDNRLFAGAAVEAGYRRGDAEWESLTQPAPDRGDLVGRVGAVVEWGPEIGPINRDLGAGLRFFVRGRGWADYAEDEQGEGEVRFRGFLDSELFYNVSDDFRVFVRYENGYLPPDLSQRLSNTFVGVGTAF